MSKASNYLPRIMISLLLFFGLNSPISAHNYENSIYKKLLIAESLASTQADSALNITNSIYTLIQSKQPINDTLLGFAQFILSECMRYKGQTNASKNYLEQAYISYYKAKNRIGLGKVYHGLGNFYLISSNYKDAIDCYKKAIQNRDSESEKKYLAISLTNLGIAYSRLNYFDSAIFYHSMSLEIRTLLKDSEGIVNSFTNIGNVYYYQNNFDKAEIFLLKAKSLIDTSEISNQFANILNTIGNIYLQKGNYSYALENFLQALNIFNLLKNEQNKAKLFNNIGLIYFEQMKLSEAKQFHNDALNLYLQYNDQSGIADTYYFLARILHDEGNLAEAEVFFNNSLNYKQEIGDSLGMADCMQNIGVICLDKNKIDSAQLLLLKSLKIYDKYRIKSRQAMTLNNLSESCIKTKNYRQAYSYAQKALKSAESYQGLLDMATSFQKLALITEKEGKYKESLQFTKNLIQITDTIFSKNQTEKLIELESKYQLERKQQAIEMQQVQLAKRDLEFKNKETEIIWQKRLRNMFLGLVLLLSALTVVLIRSLVHRKALNNKLAKQRHAILLKNEDLSQLNEELRVQQQQIVMQNETLLQQNIKIEEVNLSFQDSIHYAEYIQQAVLPSKEKMNAVLPNHFVLYMPKDIVGGDFYWVHRANNKIIIAVGDCTGHGVPGGFLSMLGLAYLKEIVTVQNIYKPNKVLDSLRTQVIDSLQQTGEGLDYIDGIDISLLVIDFQEQSIEYSGAKGKIVIISEQSTELLKGDRMTLGFSPKMKPFSCERRQLIPNQFYYLFTDGFTDQYNHTNEKFGMSQFVELCKNNYTKPLTSQKEVFFQSFQKWRGNFEQIDDATVLAFNI